MISGSVPASQQGIDTKYVSLHYALQELGGDSTPAFGNTTSGIVQVIKMGCDWSEITFQTAKKS